MEQPKHIDMQTPNGAQLNLDALYQIAPSCFTEAMGEDGEMHRVVDFNKLRLLLGDQAVEDAPEVYDFTWVGKRAALREAASPINKTLRPCPEESVDWDSTQNLYIEGDNLEVLKLLQNSYMGKVKMIYIDPPYNTGNDFVYHDDFAQSAEEYDESNRDEEGNRFRKNTDSNGRFHSDWCSMIYARLMVARSLLTDDGVIFISIDDNEVENLRKICDEVFGESNSQALISYVRKTSGKQDSSNFMNSTEYIMVYSKTNQWECQPLVADDHVTDRYNKIDDDGRKFRETDLRKTGNADRREDRPLMYYPFYFNPNTNELMPSITQRKDLVSKGYIEIYPIKPDGTAGRWRWGIDNAKNNVDFLVAREMPKYKGKYTVYEKDFIDKKGEIRTVKEHTSWDRKEFNSDNAMAEFKKMGFSNQLFPFPKSSALIKHMVYLADTQNSIIIDFFSGSGTTAQAIMQLNAEDSGCRKFIMVQLPEETEEKSEAYKAGYKNICEIGKERIRRAGKKIKEEHPEAEDLDIGFRVFKCESSNYKDVAFAPKDYTQDMLAGLLDNIKEDRTDLDLLFDCMLRWGVELSLPLSSQKVDGCTFHNVNDGDLVACFDGNVTEKVIDAIAALSPVRVVFRDSSFNEAAQKMNLFELFKQKCDWTDEEVKNNVRVI
ncbi:MAG: site-specific DNA-methyltransferase [Bacteroidaceae bacterium]|nr:site-specific DNA-methyltransferase [Bacteroidaceae bacterium]MBQ9192052.1 site-specific DNA-methyltransferase [Bacteroidaceae bacterium]